MPRRRAIRFTQALLVPLLLTLVGWSALTESVPQPTSSGGQQSSARDSVRSAQATPDTLSLLPDTLATADSSRSAIVMGDSLKADSTASPSAPSEPSTRQVPNVSASITDAMPRSDEDSTSQSVKTPARSNGTKKTGSTRKNSRKPVPVPAAVPPISSTATPAAGDSASTAISPIVPATDQHDTADNDPVMDSESAATDDPGMPLAIIGWSIAGVLAFLLLKRRAAARTPRGVATPQPPAPPLESTSAPRADTADASEALRLLSEHMARTNARLEEMMAYVRDTRQEFSALRNELDAKSRVIEQLEKGAGFHQRRPVLLSLIRSLEILDIDENAGGLDPNATLAGMRAEIQECLEDNGIYAHTPEIGIPLADSLHIDKQRVQKLPCPDEAMRGTIAGVIRPAYLMKAADGNIITLLAARVSIYA